MPREITDADAPVPADLDEKRNLAPGDAERVRLPSQLARKLEQGGPEAVRDDERFECENGHLVSHANKTR